MHPILFESGRLTIHSYGVLYALGFLAAAISWTWLARQRGWPAGMGVDLGILVMVAGVVGARLAYVLSNPAPFLREPVLILHLHKGGLVFYGGMILCALSGIVFARVRGIPVPVMADFIITSIPLGHAVGRLGCYMQGCCFGSPTTAPWAVSLAGIMRHPIQLYEAGFNLLLYGVLLWVYFRRHKDGMVLVTYLMVYPAGRLVLEFFRGDGRMDGLWLNVAQEMSILFILIGLGGWWILSRGRERNHGTSDR